MQYLDSLSDSELLNLEEESVKISKKDKRDSGL